MANQTSDQRFIFFDNLRILFVVGVVLQHAGMSYSWSEWWPVTDDSSFIVTMFIGLFDGFLMPSLFFIAGYFAIPSIHKRSIASFIKGKLKRLGIPWLICTLFIGPVLPLIFHYTRNGYCLTTSYLKIWLSLFSNAFQFDVGIMPSMNQIMENDLFYQRYMWFISLLITFFLLFALVFRLQPGWFNLVDTPPLKKPGIPSTLKMIFSIALITFAGSTLLIMIMFMTTTGVSDPESWFTFGNIIQFRVSRIFLHTVYFVTGILAFKYKWVQNGRFPGHRPTLKIMFILSFIAYYTAMLMMRSASGDMEKLLGLAFWLFLNFFTISALGLSSSLAYRYLNQSTPLNKKLAASSFNLYLVHYLLVLFFQLLLVQIIWLPVLLKYFLVSAGSVCCGYTVSHFLIKPRPKLSVVATILIFVTMIVFI